MVATGRLLLNVFLIAFDLHGRSWGEAEAGTCGGYLVDDSGTFTSPNYPQCYPNNAECTWFICASDGQRIKLNLTHFEAQFSLGCTMDYILIYDGPSRDSNLIAKTCTPLNHIFVSSSNKMTVHFVSDGTGTAQGFTAKYNSVPMNYNGPSCGGTLKDDTGSFTSPNYPEGYPTESYCTWYISVDSDKIITLKFIDIRMVTAANCKFDHIEVYNGPSRNSELIGITCTSNENTFSSSANYMTVHFKTELSGKNGFRATYQSEKRETTQPTTENNLQPTAGPQTCDVYFVADSGSFTSPNFPSPYPINTKCNWHIATRNNKNIMLIFPFIDLELSTNCSKDYIEIYDGPSLDFPFLGKICDGQNTGFKSTTNKMFITFTSDSASSGCGFIADFYALS